MYTQEDKRCGLAQLAAHVRAGDCVAVGGGGCNLSCDVESVTIWTAAHRALPDAKGRRRFRLAEACDFITSVGHRTAEGKARADMGYRGRGPDSIVTELGVFDFDETGHARLAAVYPDTDIVEVGENTGFGFPLRGDLGPVSLPTAEMVAFIRQLDPLRIHERELRPEDRARGFVLA